MRLETCDPHLGHLSVPFGKTRTARSTEYWHAFSPTRVVHNYSYPLGNRSGEGDGN